MVAPLARDIVVYTDGDANVTETIEAAAKGRCVTVEPRKIVSLKRKDAGHSKILVNFEDGKSRMETFLVSKIQLRTSIPHNLTTFFFLQ
jgi:hypothetical protein